MYAVILMCVFCFSSTTAEIATYYDIENAAQYFEEYTQKYEKDYADEQEKEARFQIFKENLDEANRLNEERDLRSSGPFVIYGITQFMDLTLAEFSNMYASFGTFNFTNYESECQVLTDRDIPTVNAPESFDWRTKKVVSEVKQQGRCASCYSFSTTGHLEGQYAIKHQQLLELSEQQIIDCDKRSHGCSTGFMSWAFMSIMELGGIEQEEDYPYIQRNGQCKFDRSKVVVKVSSCYTYQLRSQEKLKQLLYQTGPISIAVKANNLKYYHGGVFPDVYCRQGPVNHAVLLVGYGIDPMQGPYWIVKNSYGSTFGESGYFRMQRGERAFSCGMMNKYMASAVIE